MGTVLNVLKYAWMLKGPLSKLGSIVLKHKKKTGAAALAAVGIAILEGKMDISSIFTPETLSVVITAIITLVGGVGGKYIVNLINYVKVAREAFELLSVLIDSLSDGKLDPSEIQKIQKEYKDVINNLPKKKGE